MAADDVHILLRYAQTLTGVDDTISAHRAVLDRHGAVLFGKVGRPFGVKTLSTVNAEIAAGVRPRLFLAANVGGDFIVHGGEIDAVSRQLNIDERSLVPDYYARSAITAKVGTWFRLVSLNRLNPASLKKIAVASTGTPILSVLGSSRNSMFIVAVKGA